MRFTEHELTAGLTGAAKTVLAARHRGVRKGKVGIDEVWEGMERYARYQALDALSGEVLPVLVALPDAEVPAGSRPTFTDAEVADTVAALLGEDVGRVKRAVLVRTRVALVQAALTQMPPRSDPGTMVVPDHL